MKKEELKTIAEGFLSGYDKKIMSPQHSIADFVELLVSFGENLLLVSMPPEQIIYKSKPDMHLLFGREVCETMTEEGIDEVCNLINDGAEYSIMKTDGSNLSAIMSELEDKGGYLFITEEEYNKILNI
jgi:hypothetical protein